MNGETAATSWNNLNAILSQAQQARADQENLRAHTLYVRATQLDPNNSVAWAGRAAVSLDPEDAIMAAAYAVALAPTDEPARTLLAQRVQERVAASRVGDDPELIALGRDLAEAGQKAFAHQLFWRATELAPENSLAWVWRAGSTDSTAEAVSCLNRALVLDPENRQAQAGLHWLLSQKVAPTQFASPEMVRRAAKHVAEGQQFIEKGDRAQAHRLFLRASELDHRNESAWLWRASTTQDVDQALMCIEQALQLNPSNSSALNARKFLRARKLGGRPQPIAPSPEPIAPLNLPLAATASNQHMRVLLAAIAIVVLLLLLYNYLRATAIVP